MQRLIQNTAHDAHHCLTPTVITSTTTPRLLASLALSNADSSIQFCEQQVKHIQMLFATQHGNSARCLRRPLGQGTTHKSRQLTCEANICRDIGGETYQIFLSRRACMTRQAKTPRFAESTSRQTPPIHMLHIEVALCLKRAVLESCKFQIL